MVNKGFEPLAVTIDPVNHKSTIGSSKTKHIVGIHKVKVLNNVSETLIQVIVRIRAPVVANGIAELLSISSGAMRIDGYGNVPSSGIDLRIPASRPANGQY